MQRPALMLVRIFTKKEVGYSRKKKKKKILWNTCDGNMWAKNMSLTLSSNYENSKYLFDKKYFHFGTELVQDLASCKE